MHKRTRFQATVSRVGVFLPLMLMMLGCNQSNPHDILTEARLRAVAVAYLDHAVAKGRGPVDASELQQCLRNLAPFKIPENVRDELCESLILTSARDDKPFVIHYGQAIMLTPSSAAPAIAYESAGIGTSRYVAYANGEVKLVSGEEISKALRSAPPSAMP